MWLRRTASFSDKRRHKRSFPAGRLSRRRRDRTRAVPGIANQSLYVPKGETIRTARLEQKRQIGRHAGKTNHNPDRGRTRHSFMFPLSTGCRSERHLHGPFTPFQQRARHESEQGSGYTVDRKHYLQLARSIERSRDGRFIEVHEFDDAQVVESADERHTTDNIAIQRRPAWITAWSSCRWR